MKNRFSLQPAGYLFGRFGLLALLVILLVAAWKGQALIVIFMGLALSAIGIAWLWSRFSLAGIYCQRVLKENRVFPGEQVEIRLRLVNRKPLPLPWIQVDDEVPAGFIHDIPLAPGSRSGYGLLSETTALLWYTGVSWRHRLSCDKRGYYTLGPVVITSGDMFGFYRRSTIELLEDHLIVYPRIFPVAELGIPPLHPLGDSTAERRIFADPSRIIGIRDYDSRDSLKHVHWKATARHQSLLVKVFESTTTLKVALFLSVDSFQSRGVHDAAGFELGISAAASIASHVIQQGNAAGLFVNTMMADTGRPVRIPPGRDSSQLMSILEALAKVTASFETSFDDFLQSEQGNLPWGTSIVFILSSISEAMVGRLIFLREKGYRVMVLQTGEGEEEVLSYSIPCRRIRCPGDLAETTCRGAR